MELVALDLQCSKLLRGDLLAGRVSAAIEYPERFADRTWVVNELAQVKATEFDSAVIGHMVKRLLYALDQR